MIGFKAFLLERFSQAAAEESQKNTPRGQAFETATGMWLHNNTGAKNNPAQSERFALMKTLHDEAMSKLNPDVQREVKDYAEKAGRAYLGSLTKDENINPEDVSEVHHTYAGIDHLIGRRVDRAGNPHDIMIKTADGRTHGASLKFKSGTLSNNTARSYDRLMARYGMKSAIDDVWNSKKKQLGISQMSAKELKELRDNPTIIQANKEAQHEAASHHVDVFNSASPEQKRAMMMEVMKANPDVGYHYVVGNKGTSDNILDKKQYALARDAQDFQAVNGGGGRVHVTDHEGRHIMTFEHRPTHGAFSSIQVNGKLGTGAVLGAKKSKAAKKRDHKVLAFGRVNPVTPGHVKLFDSVRNIAGNLGADHEVVLSRSQDAKKNPLTPDQKLEHAKAASPETNISVADEEHPTLLHQLARAHKEGYGHITVVAGEDRVPEFNDLVNKYNGVEGKHGHYNFKSINVVSAGHRDPDAEGVEGANATSQRGHVANGRKKEFMAGVPRGVDGEKMYNDVRQGMGIK